ncbi:2-dehydro-3-deoxyphosphooctonate aldolase [Flavobacterium sp. NRK F10]|uniref:2-dehydro-3-deoxyphosphooctonate aldolase n=1 Tax=Flavobacterium sediminis TaxID=2201181 RepID=A0A2U8QY71_9FLAO|nr:MULTISPECIES: 2-dehydro-3-deoxyphosphooctonate aldolase [Flavobacterium]AWM15170.1 2-dehydro-3-deoxyphosphooctonate aldolase [Flavobacterium sediminis]MCO6176458.1 2-dehydro-3-deoxyphosphooctonate aldolase [Flavobacterium sp. NRK F10]
MKHLILFLLFLSVSCTSTKSTLKNINDTAKKPQVQNNAFIITEYAEDTKYGYDKDFPINIGLILERQEETFVTYFFNGLTGPNGEKILFKKVDTCCPFPTQHNNMGAGTLSIYEVQFEGTNITKKLYFNSYERGKIVCPKGFTIKKFQTINN